MIDIYNRLLNDVLNLDIGLISIALFAASIISVNLLVPIVIWVSLQKRLVTPVNNRSSHRSITPPFGGVAFYLIFIVSISLSQFMLNDTTGYAITASLSILFMVGLKDDLVHSTPKIKLLAQIVAGIITMGSEKFRFESGLSNKLAVGNILEIATPLLLLILIINAYNLIDGIDGLAAMTGITSCAVYAFLFYQYEDQFFFLLSIITIGVLSAFLRYNLSTGNRKIFMGDCGSLTIGLILALCTLRFLALKLCEEEAYYFPVEIRLVMVVAILFIPLFDTARIIFIRLKGRQHLFKADKNHIHHVLLRSGLTHTEASLLLSAIHISIAIVAVVLATWANMLVLCLFLVIACGAAILLFSKNRRFKSLYTSS